jgi:hypothetical protein
MRNRMVGVVGGLAAVGLGALIVAPVAGQTSKAQASGAAAAKPATAAPAKAKAVAGALRTPWGDPDLQGGWDNGTPTPLERPVKYGERATLTDAEVKALNSASADAIVNERPLRDGDVGTYNELWFERGAWLHQTSLIVNPKNGRLPPYSAEGLKRIAAGPGNANRGSGEARGRQDDSRVDGPEDRNLRERCIVLHAMPPLPTVYSDNYQIVQTPDSVAILHEEIHETRVIPIGSKPHLNSKVTQWLGDSRGHWDGNTLVVETTNIRPNFDTVITNGIVYLSEKAVITERFTRVDKTTLDYEFTVDDPTTYSYPWSAKWPWKSMDARGQMIYEYACHEDNYSLYNMLTGARAKEKEAAAKKSGGK